VQVSCQVEDVPEAGALREVEELLEGLNAHQGVLLASSYEFPGRYARWTVGFLDPPLKVESKGLEFTVTALNERGKVLLAVVHDALMESGEDGRPLLPLEGLQRNETVLRARVRACVRACVCD
jgi:anthranilate synthase